MSVLNVSFFAMLLNASVALVPAKSAASVNEPRRPKTLSSFLAKLVIDSIRSIQSQRSPAYTLVLNQSQGFCLFGAIIGFSLTETTTIKKEKQRASSSSLNNDANLRLKQTKPISTIRPTF